MAQRGRPPTPLDPTASCGARPGYQLRVCRQSKNLTLEKLAALIGFTPQRISDIERAKATASHPFLAACEEALEAAGKLLPLLPAVQLERDEARQTRADARRKGRQAESATALRCEAHSDAGDNEDVQPTNRRGLIGAGAATALGATGFAATPTQARQIDPELPAHLERLLDVLGRHDQISGPRDMLDIVQCELRAVAERREIARGELRTRLMRVESRLAAFAAWLSEDTGDLVGGSAGTKSALRLAREASYPDMVAYARARQSRCAAGELDARGAVEFAEAGMGVRGASAQTRAWCARLAALGHARAGDAAACERRMADAYNLLKDDDAPAPPWAGRFRLTLNGTLADEASCWSLLDPRKAIPLYEDALRDWPRADARDGGVQQARLALVCAATGELDRARAEGRKAFAIAQATKSRTIERELQRLTTVLRAA